MAIKNFPCDGNCDHCKFEDCILTEEQALELDIYENGEQDKVDAYEPKLSPHRKKYLRNREQVLEYHKKYYQENKDKIREYYKEWLDKNRDKVNAYQRKHKRDRKEYYRLYYLKKKGEKNGIKAESGTCISSANGIDTNATG